MLPNLRNPRSQVPAPKPASTRSTADRIPSPVLAFAVICSLALSGLTADRLVRVERAYQPAVEATRQLGATLDATRALLSDRRLGSLESRVVRADSQAQRFHRIATLATRGAEPRAQMQAYDDAFADYYVAARRAAAGLSMSAEPDGASAEDAALGYGMLRENLALGLRTQAQAIEAARPATAPVEMAAWLTLALIAGALLVRRSTWAQGDWPVAAQPAARDERTASLGESARVVPLHQAVERLARQRLAASVAAAKVAKRNNERQIEVARSWITPALTIVRDEPPRAEMDVYEDDSTNDEPRFGGLALVTA
jgi:hypothetical protein